MTLPNHLRCQVRFEESIRSKYTKKNYTSHLSQFMGFAGKKSPEQLLLVSSTELQHLMEDYLLVLKKTTKPNSVPSKFRGIRHFCVMNGIRIDWNIIYKMFPQKQKTQGLRSYTTKEVKVLLSGAKSARDKALIHFLASTGARVGVFDHDLQIRHMRKMPYGCTAVSLYAGHMEEYWAFLTPQASRALRRYHDLRIRSGERLCGSTPVFATHGAATQKQLGWSGVRSVIYRTIARSGMTRCMRDGRYDVQADHGFRKRFNTILKMDNGVNYNMAEKLMGHRNGLDGVYFTPTLEELFTEFAKVMCKIEV